MKNILERRDGVDLIESGEWGDPMLDYSVEIFDPDNEESVAHEICCKSKAEAEGLFARVHRLS